MILEIIMSVCILLIVLIVLLFLFIKRKDMKAIPEDMLKRKTVVINLMPEFTDGKAKGWEKSVTKTPSGRLICEFYPTDIDIDKEEIKPKTIIVGNNNRYVFPAGQLSGELSIVLYLPNTIKNLPKNLNQTEFGKFIHKEVIESNNLDTLFTGIEANDKKVKDIFRRAFKGELSAEELKKIEHLALISSKQHEEKK